MTHCVIKVPSSAALVVASSLASRRGFLVGRLLASLRLVLFFGLFWFYLESKDSEKLAVLFVSTLRLLLSQTRS